MPEVQHAMRAALEPRSVNRVGLTGSDRQQQRRQVGRVILEVRILDDDGVAGRNRNTGTDRGALAPVFLVMDHLVNQPFFRQGIEDFPSPVGRCVVDDDDFQPQGNRANAAQGALDRRRFVVCRHDHREQQVGGAALFPHQAASPIAMRDCPTRQGSSRSSRNSGTNAS